MDGQNFQNGLNDQNTGNTAANTGTYQDNTAAANTGTYQDNTSTYTGTYQDNTSTYTGTYQDNTAAYTSAAYGSTVTESEGGTPGLAIAGLIFGIIGIVTTCCGCTSFIFGIVGLIMAIVANNQRKSGVGTAALICSIISIVLGCIASFYWVIAIIAEM